MAVGSSEEEILPFDHDALQICLEELAADRPIFHSEADFQFALAWKIKELCNVKDVRLEYPFSHQEEGTDKIWFIDIVVILHNGKMVPIELKYKRAGLSNFVIFHDNSEEVFNLKDHGAHDFGRYDCLKDVERVEKIIKSGKDNWAAEGYAIWLTNDEKYRAEVEKEKRDTSFSLHNHTIDAGNRLFWDIPELDETSEQYEKDVKLRKKKVGGRIEPIRFEMAHEIKWQPYRPGIKSLAANATKPNEEQNINIEYALLHITNNECPTCSNPSPSLYTQP